MILIKVKTFKILLSSIYFYFVVLHTFKGKGCFTHRSWILTHMKFGKNFIALKKGYMLGWQRKNY